MKEAWARRERCLVVGCSVGGDRATFAEEPARSPRVDDRRVISGIVHMLKCGGRWQDCPLDYGRSTTVYNRWNRWSRRGLWSRILAALTEKGWIAETAQIDSSYVKAHRCSGGAKGGSCPSHWHLARWSDDKNPRTRRCSWKTAAPRADAGQHIRCQRRGPACRRNRRHEALDRRPRIRC